MRIWPVGGMLAPGSQVSIAGSDAKHIHNVLRCRPGDTLRVTDDAPKSWWARIDAASPAAIALTVTEAAPDAGNRKPSVTIALALGKPQVLELAVQKATELGAARFVPLVTKFSIADTMSEQKLVRLRKIAHEASKQCGRTGEMEVAEPGRLQELPDAALKIVLWEEEKGAPLRMLLRDAGAPESVLIVVGPQSGLAEEEVALLKERGFHSAGLGHLILRAETAAIAACAIAAYHFGKLD